MENEKLLIARIQHDIHELAKAIHDLSIKYREEPLVKEVQNEFLSLSVNIGKALGIPLQ